MVQQPWAYDVLVMENMFGDILSDLGAGLVGGLGLGPSAELGETHGLFQPSHGSAPLLAGKNVANPLATILSGAMMLSWLGDKYGDKAAHAAAERVELAVSHVLNDNKFLTPDLGGTAGTDGVAAAVIAALGRG
jgi:3-isopropylmalate dehydrogenase